MYLIWESNVGEKRERDFEIRRWYMILKKREREREKKTSFVRVEEVGASHLQIILTSKPYLLILGYLYICIYRY